MQTKSYRLLKWTLLACMCASLAPACVVTTGDGDDFFDGGEGGSSTAGTKTTTGGAGTSSGSGGKATAGSGGATAGTGNAAGSGGATAGTGNAAGSGGSAPTYEAGICDAAAAADDPPPTPSEPADVELNADDEKPENACRKCLKENCAEEWSTCYGEAPRIACGWGPSADDQDGQFDCILGCFADEAEDPMADADTIIQDCVLACTNQCDAEDNGNPMVHTSVLVGCANDPEDGCQAECFTF